MERRSLRSLGLIAAILLAGNTQATTLDNEISAFSHSLTTAPAADNDSRPRQVPVPTAVILFGSGLIGMVAIGRRRRES